MAYGERSPFVERDIKCPACGEASRQRTFRSRMFVPEEKESDQHVVRYRWLSENVAQVHPPYYFLLFCPHCHFCDMADEYENPKPNPFAQRVAKLYQKAEQRIRLIAVLLAKHINYEEIDHLSALNLHYLALFLQMQAPEDLMDNYKVARLLLRIAWLYREAGDDGGEGAVKIPGVEDALEAYDRFEDLLGRLRESWKSINASLKSRVDDVDDMAGGGDENPYRQRQAAVNRHLDGASRESYALKSLLRRDRRGNLLNDGGDDSGKFFNFPSYDAFFEQLKGVWPFAPSDEHEAMRAALHYFEKALSTDARLDDTNVRQGVMSLIIDLFVRCDDISGALAMVRGAHKSAFDARARLQQELRDPEKDDLEKRRIKSRMDRVTASLDQVSAMRRTLINQMYVRDKAKIEGILKTYTGQALEVIEEALTSAGIEPEQITALKDQGGPLAHLTKRKKRGLF